MEERYQHNEIDVTKIQNKNSRSSNPNI